MPTICDTHVLLFWAHEPERLSAAARQALEVGRSRAELAIADITLWELALLQERGRLQLPDEVDPAFYLKQLLAALELLRAVDRGEIPAVAISTDQLRPLALFDNPELETLIRRHWGNIQPGTPEEKLADIRRFSNDLRAGAGDASRGEALFVKHCGTCHKVRNVGANLGPELTGTVKGDLASLLANIVDPSAVVKKEYLTHVAQTKTGTIVSGLLVEEDAGSVTLADAKNQRTRLSRDQLEELSVSGTSLMPERLLEQLSPQELRDLFAWLRQ